MSDGIKELIVYFNKEKQKLDEVVEVLYNSAKKVKDDMIKRTKSGLDVNKQTFKEYSDKYKKKKFKKVGNNSPVNLTYKNDMLSNWKVKKIENGASIYFGGADNIKKASVHNYGEGKQKKREFIGLDEGNIDYILKEVSKGIKDE